MLKITQIFIFFLVFGLMFLGQVNTVSAVDGEITYTGSNTNLVGDDNYAGPFNLGFDFQFYNATRTSAYVNINGTLNFTGGDSSYSNGALNTGGNPRRVALRRSEFWRKNEF